MSGLESELGEQLRGAGLTLGVVESATGGLISYLITRVPGSSDYFLGAVTAYGNEVKVSLAGVSEATLREHGAVSRQVAEEMARGGRRVLGVDICLADTGIAGPGGATPGKPVGLFYLGLSAEDGTWSRELRLAGSREQNRQSAAEAALHWLREYLLARKK